MWMFIGLAWAMAAPALLLIPAAVLVWALRRARPAWPRSRAWGVALGLCALATFLAWLPARLEFHAACQALGPPKVHHRARADGFFLDDPTANSFGMRYLQEEGFRWMEARSIYQRDAYTRYELTPSGIRATEVPELTASHRAVAEHDQSHPHWSISRLQVAERTSGRLLAEGATAHFDGGPARWLLGAWGTANCPDLMSPAGSEWFNAHRHLVKNTLGAASP